MRDGVRDVSRLKWFIKPIIKGEMRHGVRDDTRFQWLVKHAAKREMSNGVGDVTRFQWLVEVPIKREVYVSEAFWKLFYLFDGFDDNFDGVDNYKVVE